MREATPRARRTGDPSLDPGEAARFAALADDWWDATGAFGPLHRINPARLEWLRDRLCAHFGRDPLSNKPLAGLRIVDVGCGGGLVCEPLARLGATVTGIDAVAEGVRAAIAHAEGARLAIEYRVATAEALLAAGESFDAVVSLEVVEHVADRAAFVATLCGLVAPGGALALSTLNRTPRAYALAIVGAEYVMGWLPRGTHRWSKFVRPSELARDLAAGGFRLTGLAGLAYDPAQDEWRLNRDLSVNYFAFAVTG
jgi:2-polyprenyl-6-hydroxyphenyl methylase / 3-demethylubiquinone-9 3-methyltransferase